MSANAPVPPPPLAPPLAPPIAPPFPIGGVGKLPTQLHRKIILENFVHYEPNAEQEVKKTMERLWEREGWTDIPILTIYQYIQPVLQVGPQCGLVALSMAVASCQTFISVQTLFQEARDRGYSYHGEMFSVDNMANLALALIPQTISVQIIKGLVENRDLIMHSLAGGATLLVPYDSDRNHEPCCLKGHKAHWAAVCGALVCPNKILIFARQGKSRRLMLWDFGQLAESNNNLFELNPERNGDLKKYLLPEGGVQAGLCGRAIILQRM